MNHSHNIGNNLMPVLVAQSCPTLFDPMDCSLSGSSVHGILQTRILEGCRTLLQGIFPTQGWNSGLLNSRQIFLLFEPQGNPHNLIDSTYLFKIFAQVCPFIIRVI